MNLKPLLFSIGALLSGIAIPAVAAPYLVYQGTLAQTSEVSPSTATDAQTVITNHIASFHRLNTTLQKDINGWLTARTATTSTVVYLIVDAADVSQYTFVLLDPTQTSKKIPTIVTSNLPADAQAENFLSGFDFPTKGGLGIFRLGVVRSAGNDPISGLPVSLLIQGYGTGALTTTTGATIAPARAAESFYVLVNGVKGAHETVTAEPAITLPASTAYMPTIAGTVFSYYFDDATTQSIGGATTKGSFTLTLNPSLTQLANHGGEYAPNRTNIGLAPAITTSTAAAYKTWVKSLIGIAAGA
jgi:hypothetical protein